MTIPIALALGAVVTFPVLKMAGIEVKSSYIVVAALILGALASLVVWRFLRNQFGRKRG